MSVFKQSLPSECSDHVFSFLELRDCLTFVSVSFSAMREILPSLHHRRLCMKQTSAIIRSKQETGGDTHQNSGIPEDDRERYSKVPTVQQRIGQLYRRLPSCHPMQGMVRLLMKNLQSTLGEELVLDPSVRRPFTEIAASLRHVTEALLLHYGIVAFAAFSDPMSNGGGVGCSVCTLDQYIGDVLCVTYLYDNSSNNHDVNRKLREQASSSGTSCSCYQSFVFLHSCILRNKTFSSDERQRLGISEFPPEFEMQPSVDFINGNLFLSSSLTFIFSSFGPLGPAFRGRDTVRLRPVSARCLYAYLNNNNPTMSGALLGPEEATTSALDWLFLVHEEVRKARPMTVRAPVLRLSLPTISGDHPR